MPDLKKKIAVHDDLVGQEVLGKFRIEQILSTGASGTIYRAQQLSLQREVALKVLNNDLSGDEEGLKRFQREAKAARSFSSHTGLATVFECGFMDDNRPFIAMQLAEGEPLSSYLENCGCLVAEDAIGLFVRVADALAFAHTNEVLHRDICPANIMLAGGADPLHNPKVVDFGLARPTGSWALQTAQLTRFSSALGNPLYMSPEQCSGKDVDGRSDIYSLGCTLYECVTGKPPFEGRTTLECMQKHHSERPKLAVVQAKRPEVGSALAQVIAYCLEKEPHKRYANMDELRVALQAALEGQTMEPSPQPELSKDTQNTETADRTKTNAAPLPPPIETVSDNSLVRSAIRSAIEVQWGVQRLALILASLVVVIVFAIVVGPQLLSQLAHQPAPDEGFPETVGDSIAIHSTMGSVDFTVTHCAPDACTFPGILLYARDHEQYVGTESAGKINAVAHLPLKASGLASDGAGKLYLAANDAILIADEKKSVASEPTVLFRQINLQGVRYNKSKHRLFCSSTALPEAARFTHHKNFSGPDSTGVAIIGLDTTDKKITSENLVRLDDPGRSNRFAFGPENNVWTWSFDGKQTKFYCVPFEESTRLDDGPVSIREADLQYTAPIAIQQMYFHGKDLWLLTKNNELWCVHSADRNVEIYPMPADIRLIDFQVTD